MSNDREIALNWLWGEDDYQWQREDEGKFPITSDIEDLRKGPGMGWDKIFHNRWTSICVFRAGGVEFSPQTFQNVGKLAAGARALRVTLEVVASGEKPEEVFERVNQASWADLELITAYRSELPDDYDDALAHDFRDTRISRAFQNLHLPLLPDQLVSPTQLVHARHLAIAGFMTLAGYVKHMPDISDVPRPGVHSGVIEPWAYTQKPFASTNS